MPVDHVQPAYDRVANMQHAQVVSQNFGIPMQHTGAGMWANILPAAIQIKEHEKMNQVALQYQQQYVENFKRRYGFDNDTLEELKQEFRGITDHITNLIPDGELRSMYRKYVESYPNMYLSMIPAEALQAKLAVKCHHDNRQLREEVTEMSACVTTLVRSLSKLQMAAGVPPIVSLMFESMPDPLTAITDPMYSAYNDAIKTYHELANGTGAFVIDAEVQGQPGIQSQTLLSENPKDALDRYRRVLENAATPDNQDPRFPDSEVSLSRVKALEKVILNMGTSGGCQTFGDEWNHMGPEPPMNPAMCLAEEDSMQPGNPRHNLGRTAVYKAQRTRDGGARWVIKGQVPNPAENAPLYNQAQIVHNARYNPQGAGDWAPYHQQAHAGGQYVQQPQLPGGYALAARPRKTKKGKKAKKPKRKSR